MVTILFTSGKSKNATTSTNISVGPINSTKVMEWGDVKSSLSSSGYNFSNAILHLSVTAQDQGGSGETHAHSYFFHPASLANAPLQDPGLTLTQGSKSGVLTFTVTAIKAVAAWVWIDYTSTNVQGYWSENGFWLKKGESKTVTFTVWNDWSGGEWANTVSVRSLWDNTRH